MIDAPAIKPTKAKASTIHIIIFFKACALLMVKIQLRTVKNLDKSPVIIKTPTRMRSEPQTILMTL